MRIIPTPDCNIVYKAPEGGELGGQKVRDMPCQREIIGWMIAHPSKGPTKVEGPGPHRVMNHKGEIDLVPAFPTVALATTWQLDTDDLAKLAASSLLRVVVLGEPHPPMQIKAVAPGQERVDPPIARAHLERAVGLLVGKLADMGMNPAHPDDVMRGLNECLLETAGEGMEG